MKCDFADISKLKKKGLNKCGVDNIRIYKVM